MLKLTLLPKPLPSPYPGSPYIAKMECDRFSQVLSWTEVRDLHETARILCPQRFSWWCSLPPELWLVPRLPYLCPPISLENCEALRVDIRSGAQFSGEPVLYLTKEQLISLRKVAYRVRSDLDMYAATQKIPSAYLFQEGSV